MDTVIEEFVDEGISGSKGREKRPALDRMLKAVIRGEVDVVAAWSVDWLGRSLQDLVGVLTRISQMAWLPADLLPCFRQRGQEVTWRERASSTFTRRVRHSAVTRAGLTF